MYPNFKWDEFYWTSSVRLPSWAGFEFKHSGESEPDDLIEIVFAPEGRDEAALNEEEIKLVNWVVENEKSIHDSFLNALLEKYPEIKSEFSDCYEEEEAHEFLPDVKNVSDLEKIVNVDSVNIHQLDFSEPFFGVVLNCSWDDEHGVGILMHGLYQATKLRDAIGMPQSTFDNYHKELKEKGKLYEVIQEAGWNHLSGTEAKESLGTSRRHFVKTEPLKEPTS